MGLGQRIRDRISRAFQRGRDLIFGRKPEEIVDPAVAEAQLKKYIPRFEAQVERITPDMVEGRMQFRAWRELLWNGIRDVYMTALVAGAGGVDKVTAQDRDRYDKVLAEQQKYFMTFMSQVERSENRNAAQIIRRAKEYAKNAFRLLSAVAQEGRPNFPELPFHPKDRTDCGQNCYCRWQITDVDVEKGDYDCFWKLDPTKENCQVCIRRADYCNPLQVRGGVVQGRIPDNLYTKRKS